MPFEIKNTKDFLILSFFLCGFVLFLNTKLQVLHNT